MWWLKDTKRSTVRSEWGNNTWNHNSNKPIAGAHIQTDGLAYTVHIFKHGHGARSHALPLCMYEWWDDTANECGPRTIQMIFFCVACRSHMDLVVVQPGCVRARCRSARIEISFHMTEQIQSEWAWVSVCVCVCTRSGCIDSEEKS